MIEKIVNSLVGRRRSRYVVFATIFFAFLATYMESGIQAFVAAHVNQYLSALVLSVGLTAVTAGATRLLAWILVRCRSGLYMYGLCLETDAAPHFIVGFFWSEYDANNHRHCVRTARCFDCENVERAGATLVDIASPRARWTADKIWITEKHFDIVYSFEKLGAGGPGERPKGGTPSCYLGLMLLESDLDSPEGARYRGEVRYIQEDSHDHHGYVYCEKVSIQGSSPEDCIAAAEHHLRGKKARELVDAVARVRNEKRANDATGHSAVSRRVRSPAT